MAPMFGWGGLETLDECGSTTLFFSISPASQVSTPPFQSVQIIIVLAEKWGRVSKIASFYLSDL